jgi:hypothetical protein
MVSSKDPYSIPLKICIQHSSQAYAIHNPKYKLHFWLIELFGAPSSPPPLPSLSVVCIRIMFDVFPGLFVCPPACLPCLVFLSVCLQEQNTQIDETPLLAVQWEAKTSEQSRVS